MSFENFLEAGYKTFDDCISCLDFSPLDDCFSIGLIDERVVIWKDKIENYANLPEPKIREGHSMGVIDVKFNGDGTRMAVSSLDSIVRIYNVDNLEIIKEISYGPM